MSSALRFLPSALYGGRFVISVSLLLILLHNQRTHCNILSANLDNWGIYDVKNPLVPLSLEMQAELDWLSPQVPLPHTFTMLKKEDPYGMEDHTSNISGSSVVGSRKYTSNPDCNSVSDPTGLSWNCVRYYRNDNLSWLFWQTGVPISFTVRGLIRECAGRKCWDTGLMCNMACECCQYYAGQNPGFQFGMFTPKNMSTIYTQFLNCSTDSGPADSKGSWQGTCTFTGRGMASLLVPVIWNYTYPPFTGYHGLNTFIVPGPASTLGGWAWDSGKNSFTVEDAGVLRVYLQDGYGNPIARSSGADDVPLPFNFTVKVTKLESPQTEAPVTLLKAPRILDTMYLGYYTIIFYVNDAGTFRIYVGTDRGDSVQKMAAEFKVTKAAPSAAQLGKTGMHSDVKDDLQVDLAAPAKFSYKSSNLVTMFFSVLFILGS